MTTAPLRITPTPSEAAAARGPIQFPVALPERNPFRATRKPARDSSFLSALIDCTEEQSVQPHRNEGYRLADPDERKRSADEARIRRDVAEERKRQESERQKPGVAASQPQFEDEQSRRAVEALRLLAEEQKRHKAEEQAKQEAEARARREAETLRLQAEEQKRREAEEQARLAAEEQARREAEALRLEEEEQNLRDAEELQRRFQLELDRLAIELRRREEAELARRQADESARREAEERERLAAEEQERLEAEAQRHKEEARAEREAEEKFRAAMERVRQVAEERRQRQRKEMEFVADEPEQPQLSPVARPVEFETPAATVLFRPVKPKQSVPGMLMRAWSFLNRKVAPTKQLRVAETVSLGDKRFVAVVQVEGRKFLIGGGSAGVALLTQLGDAATDANVAMAVKPNGGLG